MSIDVLARRVIGETTLRLTDKGWSGSIPIVMAQNEVYDVPRPGAPWPFTYHNLPYLKLIQIDWLEQTNESFRAKLEYSTEADDDVEYYEASQDLGARQVDKTSGWVWRDSQRPIIKGIPTLEAVTNYTISVKRSAPPYDVMQAAIGRLNDRIFHGYAAETMQFLGCRVRESQGFERNLIRVSSEYVFEIGTYSHQLMYREPLIDVDKDGNEIMWQNKESTKPGYTTNTLLIGTPVYVAGTAGQPGLDMPLNTHDRDEEDNPKPLYDLCDFASILGLPIKDGDDSAGGDPPA